MTPREIIFKANKTGHNGKVDELSCSGGSGGPGGPTGPWGHSKRTERGKVNQPGLVILRRWWAAILGAIWLLSSLPVWADQKSIDAALTGLSERYRSLSSLVSDYTRTTKSPSTDEVFTGQVSQTAEGVLSWKNLSMLRLDQKTPEVQAMMTDGQTVWWYVPEERQVYVYRQIDLAGQLSPLLSFMAGLDRLKESFKITEATDEDVRDGQIGLILNPIDNNEEASGLLIVYCDGDYRLTGFRLVAITGEKTDFYLSDIKLDPELKDDFFVFKVPRGVKVIEEEEMAP
ncbi:MAG: outer-membrane lipoprotein carrier protein LolA [Deltaproteobacteria bacterium]|jgi:outer membrane lipoprotein-sorting protein|nr:outer-membrane lipoprotein carrier protein LolA [Deltaproteobacteria bacterium]